MSVHVSWKEVGAKVENIETLQALADALAKTNIGRTMVYFEFQNADELLQFCKIVRAIPIWKDIQRLDTERTRLSKEARELEEELEKLSEKVRKKRNPD